MCADKNIHTSTSTQRSNWPHLITKVKLTTQRSNWPHLITKVKLTTQRSNWPHLITKVKLTRKGSNWPHLITQVRASTAARWHVWTWHASVALRVLLTGCKVYVRTDKHSSLTTTDFNTGQPDNTTNTNILTFQRQKPLQQTKSKSWQLLPMSMANSPVSRSLLLWLLSAVSAAVSSRWRTRSFRRFFSSGALLTTHTTLTWPHIG